MLFSCQTWSLNLNLCIQLVCFIGCSYSISAKSGNLQWHEVKQPLAKESVWSLTLSKCHDVPTTNGSEGRWCASSFPHCETSGLMLLLLLWLCIPNYRSYSFFIFYSDCDTIDREALHGCRMKEPPWIFILPRTCNSVHQFPKESRTFEQWHKFFGGKIQQLDWERVHSTMF